MSDNNHQFRGGKGYYIALVLCAAAIGITGYVYHRNTPEAEPLTVQETYEDVLAGTLDTQDVAVIATQPRPGTAAEPTVPQTTTPAATEKKAMKTMSPVAGAEIYGYSMEALSYNQTTRDWRTHNGLDLAAETGAEVYACADGEVYAVYADDAYGQTVVIRHDDGYTSCCASLSEETPVKAGDTVTMGQVIGYAGDSAIVESTMGSHVHFSVTRYSEPIDPAEFLALGS